MKFSSPVCRHHPERMVNQHLIRMYGPISDFDREDRGARALGKRRECEICRKKSNRIIVITPKVDSQIRKIMNLIEEVEKNILEGKTIE